MFLASCKPSKDEIIPPESSQFRETLKFKYNLQP